MNPFLINNYISPDYFCNREKETKALISNIKNQSNTSFFSQRRIGKSGLIHHVFYRLKRQKTTCIYIDIFATQDLKDLANQLANGIYQAFPPEKKIGKLFVETLKLLRPVFSFNELSGNAEVTLDLTRSEQVKHSVPQLLEFLDKQKTPIVIAIDEFQQILYYPEKNVEAILRTVIQRLAHVNFIFCGSNQRLMTEIFNNTKRPFYASTLNLNLKKIEALDYAPFIRRHFTTNNISVDDDTIEFIINQSCSHTYYTQRLCHEVFAMNQPKVNRELVTKALYKIVTENENIYFQYRSLHTPNQWKLLKAIAKEERVNQPFAQKFISTHDLGTPANVKRGLTSLLEKEMIYMHFLEDSHYYEVQDKFLMRWLAAQR